MILTCPECATRYLTKPEAIGPQGRTVRCNNCNETWFVKPEADILELSSQPEGFAAQAGENSGVAIGAGGAGAALNGGADSNSANVAQTFRNDIDRKRGVRRWLGVALIWICTFAFIALAGLLAYIFRQQIVEKFPAAATIYKALDIKVAQGGILFGDVITRSAYIEGELTTIAEGRVYNPSNAPRDIRSIQFNLDAPGGQVLAQWSVLPGSEPLPKTELAAGESLTFLTQYTNPPVDAVTLSYKFANADIAGQNELPAIDPLGGVVPVVSNISQDAGAHSGQGEPQ